MLEIPTYSLAEPEEQQVGPHFSLEACATAWNIAKMAYLEMGSAELLLQKAGKRADLDMRYKLIAHIHDAVTDTNVYVISSR